MKTRAILALTAVAGIASVANAQAGLAIRFSNGTNAITVAPNAAVPVQVWAVGLPIGSVIPWTSGGGSGAPGTVVGFESVLFNLLGSGGTWSGGAINLASGLSPLSGAGTAAGSNYNNINPGIAFNPPIAQTSFMLWSGTLTVGSSNVNLNTLILPVGAPPETGIAVSLNTGLPFNVQQFIQSANGTGTITVPAPASLALLGLGGLVAGRRRR
jgi:hypothetical protein